MKKTFNKISRHSSSVGSFLVYKWKNEPLNVFYCKRSYVIDVVINGETYILGTGYPLHKINSNY